MCKTAYNSSPKFNSLSSQMLPFSDRIQLLSIVVSIVMLSQPFSTLCRGVEATSVPFPAVTVVFCLCCFWIQCQICVYLKKNVCYQQFDYFAFQLCQCSVRIKRTLPYTKQKERIGLNNNKSWSWFALRFSHF